MACFPGASFSMEPELEHLASSISFASYLRLLRGNRNFRRLWSAQIVSEIGDWFYTLSIYSLLLQLTGHASSVALALVLQVLPQTFVGPTAGVVNDRISRKKVMIAADLIRVVIVLAMLLVRSKSMVWFVYPLLLLETIMAAFFEPARSSVIPNITRREDVIVANTLSSTTWSMNLVLGATLGGIVAALLGRDAVFVLNALSFLVSALLIAGMRFAEPHAEASAPLRPRDLVDYSPVVEGIRYVRGKRTLFATVFAKAGNLVIGPSWVLFTVMGQRYFPVHWHNVDRQSRQCLGSLLLGRVCPLRRRDGLGLLDNAAAVEHRRPVSWASVFGRSRPVHVDDCCWRVREWCFSGCGNLCAHTGHRNRSGHASSCSVVGLGDEVMEASGAARDGFGGLRRLLGAERRQVGIWWILAAMMKSLSVRPLTLCVHNVISTLPHASKMSG